MRSHFSFINHLLRWLGRVWPVILLLIVELIIVRQNYTPGTFLIGWDNVVPEFNFPVNFLRSLVGVWQEHRGLGLYDGMSHIANLPHTLILWLFSLALPLNTLRYGFTFIMHFLGGLGVYKLLKKLRSPNPGNEDNNLSALVGGLFYLLSAATIQMFYTPLEAFSVHFAALPWLALTLINYLGNSSRKTYFLWLLTALLTTPQYFVTTLALPVVILLAIISLSYLLSNFRLYVRPVLMAAMGFLLVNAFWLLPYGAGLPTNAPIIASAKINQMSSLEAFIRNQAFGIPKDVLLLHGFSLDFQDVTSNGTFGYLMSFWRFWWSTPPITILAFIFLALTGIGLVTHWRERQTRWVLAVWLVAFSFLASDTPLVREGIVFLRDHVPFFSEAFRFSFTKFSLLFAFAYSLAFAWGFKTASDWLSKHEFLKRWMFTTIVILFILAQAAPAFTGDFLYTNLKVQLPTDYQALFADMLKRDPNARVAYLPQPDYWSWKLYQFGYRGSGFVWYGLNQPLLDRAFDPWSNYNENYYWELTRALYAKDAGALTSVLTKYDIHFIVLDENLVSQSHDRALFTEETKDLLTHLPQTSQVETLGKISLYELGNHDSTSFVRLTGPLPGVSPSYQWTDNDLAYQKLGDYENGSDYVLPFRSLFTKRSVEERGFTVRDSGQELLISDAANTTTVPVDKQLNVVYESSISNNLQAKNVVQCDSLTPGIASAKNETDTVGSFLRFTSNNQRGCLSFGAGDLGHGQGYLVAVESRHRSGLSLLFSLINQTAKHVESETYLSTQSDWTTSYFILPPLAADGVGYTVYISNNGIGHTSSVNDLRSVKIYQFPYQDLINLSQPDLPNKPSANYVTNFQVSHPNPAYFLVKIQDHEPATLILDEAYHWGWKAYQVQGSLSAWLPFLFGHELPGHVLVNNWANGWKLTGNESEVVIFFWPQLLEWLGFALLPLPFLWLLQAKKRT